MKLQTRIDTARNAAKQASDIALSLFNKRSEFLIQSKRARDFVSEADRVVERAIRTTLNDSFPDDLILGEELGGDVEDTFWTIDPIDGTANFLKGSPLWGVSIAYVAKGVSQLGVISLPCLNLFVSAQRGEGAFCNGVRIEKSVPTEIRIASVGENPYWPSTSLAKLEQSLRDAQWGIAEYRCATVGLVFAALGFTDGYLEKMTSSWDITAGAVICEEAGLQVQVCGELTRPAGMSVRAGSQELLANVDALWPSL